MFVRNEREESVVDGVVGSRVKVRLEELLNLDRVFVCGLFLKPLSVEMKRSGSFGDWGQFGLASFIWFEEIPRLKRQYILFFLSRKASASNL